MSLSSLAAERSSPSSSQENPWPPHGAVSLLSSVNSMAAADVTPLLPGQGLMVNSFSGVNSEPQFGAAAATAGEIGLEAVIQGGLIVGYQITAAGMNGNILTILSGQ